MTLPLLRFLSDGKRRSRPEWENAIARELRVSEEDVATPKAKGGGTLFANHASWAWIHLHKAGLVEGESRREVWITRTGKELLATSPKQIDGPVLYRYESYRHWPKHWKNPLLYLEPTDDPGELHRRAQRIIKAGAARHPKGIAKPTKLQFASTRYKTDPHVYAAMQTRADGCCECCNEVAPFARGDGTKYLELHHVRPLSEGGPDFVSNAVAVCPNCHRALHLARDARQRAEALFSKHKFLRPYPAVVSGADAA